MKFNKPLAVLLAVMLSVCMASCGDSSDEDQSSSVIESDDSVDSAVGYSDGTFKNSYYTLNVNEDIWTYSETDDADCSFSYYFTDEDGNSCAASFNVICLTSDEVDGQSAQEYGEAIVESYESMDGYEFVESGTGTLDEYETYWLHVSYTSDDDTTTALYQDIASNGEVMVVFSYGALDSVIDELMPIFSEMIDGFEFK
ncbi:MAG: hypothetical protein LUI06_06070 [Ruminococcus sp.]|nr:hypothetical protein [Ruminococcus sp.]